MLSFLGKVTQEKPNQKGLIGRAVNLHFEAEEFLCIISIPGPYQHTCALQEGCPTLIDSQCVERQTNLKKKHMHLLLMQFFNRNCKKIPDHQNISKPLTKFMVVILQPGCSGNRTSNDMKELPDLGSKEPNHGVFSKGRFLISKSLAISFYVLVYIFSDRFFECLFLHICILGSCKQFFTICTSINILNTKSQGFCCHSESLEIL